MCQSEDAIDRTWRGQAKVERKLGHPQGRPKGMHETTHQRLVDKVKTAERERRTLMGAGYRRLLKLD